jgi:ADP-ribose pyrophosphatase YjhB (NUDIX family)
VAEETNLEVESLGLIGVYDFQRMNQLIVAYHAAARGEVRLSPELAEYKLFAPADVRCWRAGTGYALADWLKSRGHEPQFIELPRQA